MRQYDSGEDYTIGVGDYTPAPVYSAPVYYAPPVEQYFALPPPPEQFFALPPPPVSAGPVHQINPDTGYPFFGLPPPPVSAGPQLSTGLALAPGQVYSPGVSRVGPTASAMPFAALDPNIRAGALFSGLGRSQSFRAPRSVSTQRAFTVDLQERLRRRRRNRFMA